MNEVNAPRARLVEMLWQLKQTYDKHGDKGVRYVHFNTLLKDARYRRELIDQAAVSTNDEIRELGLALQDINTDGELTHGKRLVASGLLLNPDIAETVGAKQRKAPEPKDAPVKSMWPRIGLAALATLVLAGGFWLGLSPGSGSNEQHISGSLFGEHVWTSDSTWVLDNIVYLEAGARLHVQQGTTIVGKPGSALVVTRDATIMARGSAEAPVVFTSAKAVGSRAAGDWGGLVLLGNAPVNTRVAQIEGVPASDSRGSFGGGMSNDSCGVLEFVRIEYAGFEVYANNELNGLTLGGCGSNTIVRNVQVHRSLDDGVEMFGGTVELKNIVVTGAADDSIDWDMGWTGRVQYLLVQQYPGMGDNAIEADNLELNHRATPRSEPIFFNVSLLSSGDPEKFQRAMTLRRGTAGHFKNVVISGFSGEAIDIKDEATTENLLSGKLSFEGLLISHIGADGQSYFSSETGSQDDDAGLDEASFFSGYADYTGERLAPASDANLASPDFRLPADSAAAQRAVTVPEGEFWDEAANFRGAIRPGGQAHWLQGWTDFSVN